MRSLARALLASLLLLSLAIGARSQELADLAFAERHRSLPDEIDVLGPQLTELASGLWEKVLGVHHDLFLAVAVGNRSGAPQPLAPFRLIVRDEQGADAIVFQCEPERGQKSDVLLPGRNTGFLCRASTYKTGADVAILFSLASAHPDRMAVKASVIARPQVRPPAAERRSAMAPPAVREPARQRVYDVPAQETWQQYQARERKEARWAAAQHGDYGFFGLPPNFWPHHALLRLLFVLAVVAAYYAMSQAVGNTLAAFLAWLIATGWVVGAITQTAWTGLGDLIAAAILLIAAQLPAIALHQVAALIDWYRTDRQGLALANRKVLFSMGCLLGTAALIWLSDQLLGSP